MTSGTSPVVHPVTSAVAKIDRYRKPTKRRSVEEKEGRTDILEIVVLSTGADALLRVGSALQAGLFTSGVDLSKEDRLELVHARVCELQSGVIVGNDGGGRNERMPMFLREEINEGLTDFLTGPIRHG